MKTTQLLRSRALPLFGALAFAGALVLGLSGCDIALGKSKEVAVVAGPTVSAAIVVEKPITETREFSGRMEAIERVDVHARVSGFITTVNVQPGGLVKKGDVLFVIDQRPYQAELDRAVATAAAARAKAELAKLDFSRAQKLVAEQAIAQRELDSTKSDFEEADADVRAADAQVENAKLNLSYTRVISPIDGRVGKAEITLGNLIDSSKILTTVVSNDNIYASFDGDEDTFLRVRTAARQGMRVNVRVGLANESGYPHAGTLEFVDNQLDAQTGGVRMRAVFTNADQTLAPGLFARVELEGGSDGETTDAVLINERAIGTDQSRKFVYIVDADNKAVYRQITLGPVADGLRIVRSGLKPGEKIVVNGLPRVQAGALLFPHIVSMDFDADSPETTKVATKAALPLATKG